MARASSASAWRRSSGLPVGELRAQGGEHERPVGVVGGEPIEGHLQDLDLVGVDGADGGEHAPVVGQGGGHEPVGVTEVGGPASGVEEGVAEGGVAGLALGGAEPDGQVEPEDRIGVVGLGVEVEGLGVVAQGVGGGERGEGGVGRLARVVDGLGRGRSGWVALNQWRASSPTRDPGRSPQRSSSASATCRCARARRVGPRSSYRVCWMRAWAKL